MPDIIKSFVVQMPRGDGGKEGITIYSMSDGSVITQPSWWIPPTIKEQNESKTRDGSNK